MTEIIAEIGINHNGDKELAWDLSCRAHQAGADWIKFQKFSAERMDNPSLKRYEFSEAEWKELWEGFGRDGLKVFASVFSPEDVEFMESLGVEKYKIAKGKAIDKGILTAVHKTKKLVLISISPQDMFHVGLTRANEYPFAPVLPDKIKFLHCVGKYPTRVSETDLTSIVTEQFDGYSSHTGTPVDCIAAAVIGAKIIEVHVKPDNAKNTDNPDYSSSITLDEFRKMVPIIRSLER